MGDPSWRRPAHSWHRALLVLLTLETIVAVGLGCWTGLWGAARSSRAARQVVDEVRAQQAAESLLAQVVCMLDAAQAALPEIRLAQRDATARVQFGEHGAFISTDNRSNTASREDTAGRVVPPGDVAIYATGESGGKR